MAGTEKSILFKLHTKPLLFLSIFFFFSSLALLAAAPPPSSSPPPHALLNLDNYNIINLKPEEETVNALFYHQVHQVQQGRWSLRRRVLSTDQPGSWPPLCISKCDQCTPCKPVHVPVPPGTPVTTEYYPVAWRCKCGNKLYMP